MNPFKYGVLVDNEYFTDRSEELKEIAKSLNISTAQTVLFW